MSNYYFLEFPNFPLDMLCFYNEKGKKVLNQLPINIDSVIGPRKVLLPGKL